MSDSTPRKPGNSRTESQLYTIPSKPESKPTTKAPDPPSILSRHRWLIDAWASERLVEKATGGKKRAASERLRKDLRNYADELAGPNPTPIERTLAETAALAWLAMRYLDVNDFTGENRSINQGLYAMRRADAAHRRYLSTLRTLATVRKLALPALLQVNVGNQVNAIAANSLATAPAKSQ